MGELEVPQEMTSRDSAAAEAGAPPAVGGDGGGEGRPEPPSLDELRRRTGWGADRRPSHDSLRPLPSLLAEHLPAGEKELVGASPQMLRVKEIIPRVAESGSPVLIEGESGTGKELVAVAIHRQSPRNRRPFVAVNCGAIPPDLLESEFFGHVRGAFTGAVNDTLGLLRSAHGGTLFLDEVAELPPRLQIKLLRVLDEKRVRPVGSTKLYLVDVRIIAASNRRLEEAIREGSFRVDLFYRLNVVRIVIPPLRERKADVPALAAHFLRQFNERFGRDVQAITPDALAALLAYDFPGNVRELENLLERAYAFGADRKITAADLSAIAPGARAVRPAEKLPTLAEAERELILRALRLYRNDKEEAARSLGISHRTIHRRLKEYGLP